MNIIHTNIDTNNKRALYAITHGKAKKVNDLDNNSRVALTKYAIYEDVDAKGVSKIVAAFELDGEKYASASPTFTKSLMDICEFLAGEEIEIIIKKAESKSGRQFLDCELAC